MVSAYRLAREVPGFIYLIVFILFAWLIVTVAVKPAHARWKAEYATEYTNEEQQWFRERKTTPEFREKRNLPWYVYCCDHSDVVEAQFQKDGSGWKYRLPGESEWKLLPADVVQEDIPTPRSRPVLFVDPTHLNIGPTCFFPGAAGS